MAYEDGRLTGDQIDSVGKIVDLLEARNRLDPSSESEVQRSGRLMELASLHENRDAKRRYLEDALAVINSANERYPGDASILVGKARVLSGFRAAVSAASPNHPDVVLISATQSVSTVNGWDVSDPNRADLEEIDEWLMAADAESITSGEPSRCTSGSFAIILDSFRGTRTRCGCPVAEKRTIMGPTITAISGIWRGFRRSVV
ncbi:MAG: hypothetical protein ACOCU4_04675 [Alkalispirochaeta sp.]